MLVANWLNFRRPRSIKNTILKLIIKIQNFIDKTKDSLSAFLDLAIHFSTASKVKLLNILLIPKNDDAYIRSNIML